MAKTILLSYLPRIVILHIPTPPPPLPIPGTSRQDLYLFRAFRDEHTLNTEVRPPSLTCVMDSLYEYLGLRLVDNLRHYSTE